MSEQNDQQALTETEVLREEAKKQMSDETAEPEIRREGLRKMLRASDAGDPEAMYIIGKMLLDGTLRPVEGSGIEQGVSLLCRAARQGFLPARRKLLFYRHSRYREVQQRAHPAGGPLKGFDGKEIHIGRTGKLTPVDAVLSYENGQNLLTLSLNLCFLEDEKSIPDPEQLHQAVIRGMLSWAGEYTVFGGQQLKVDIRITVEPRVFDNVLVYICSGSNEKLLNSMMQSVPTKTAKQNQQTMIRQKRAAAGVGRKWSVRSRKVIYLQTRSGRFDNYDEIALIARHEFGHVLGLGDLYAETAKGLEGVPAGTWAELDAYLVNDRDYSLVMCHETGLITGNDMEMVVLAFSKNRPQVYQPDRYVKIVSEALGKGN
jgi:hypothetical protein